jgi:hypothetical protein
MNPTSPPFLNVRNYVHSDIQPLLTSRPSVVISGQSTVSRLERQLSDHAEDVELSLELPSVLL